MDEKQERFVRIAENRTNKIIDMIKLLGNCSNKNNYSYSDQQVEKIFNAIEQELKKAKNKYMINKDNGKFSLR